MINLNQRTLQVIIFLMLMISSHSHMRAQLTTSEDSLFSYSEFILNLLSQHPLAKQAELKDEQAKTILRKARGKFDPKLEADFDEKNYKDHLYYKHFSSKLRVPTILGIDIVGGYTQNAGEYLNPEFKTDDEGLWNVGVEANLLQGLLTDKRRTDLRKARLYQTATLLEKQLMLNDLIYEASVAYTNWQVACFTDKILQEGVELAKGYNKGVIEAFTNGEKSAIDTLESDIFVQDSQIAWHDNQRNLVKARQAFERFLWLQDQPASLNPGISPETLDSMWVINPDTLDLDAYVERHPKIQEKSLKLQTWELTQRLNKQALLPKLKVKYTPLVSASSSYDPDNLKWGLSLSMPLLLRKERADLTMSKLETRSARFQLDDEKVQLRGKIKSFIQLLDVTASQIELQQKNLVGYRSLMEGEYEKFSLGESSLFLLNKRQEKYIAGQIKLIKIKAKQRTEMLHLQKMLNNFLQ